MKNSIETGEFDGYLHSNTFQKPHTKLILDCVQQYLNLGIKVIPAYFKKSGDKFEKRPLVKFAHIREQLTIEHCRQFWNEHPNAEALMLLTDTGLYVLDADTPESLNAIISIEKKFNIEPSIVVKTQKGEHHYFELETGVVAKPRGYSTSNTPEKIDVRTGKSVVVGYPSHRDNKTIYELKKGTINDFSSLNKVGQDFVDHIELRNGETLKLTPVTQQNKEFGKVYFDDREKWYLEKLLFHIDPDESYDTWLKCLFASSNHYAYSDSLLNTLDIWSQKGQSYKSNKEIEDKLNSMVSNGGLTLSSIRYFASNNGADLTNIDRFYDSKAWKFNDFNECISELQRNNNSEEAFEAALQYLSSMATLEQTQHLKSLQSVTLLSRTKLESMLKKIDKHRSMTHYQMAVLFLNSNYTERPVAEFGQIFSYSNDKGIWEPKSLNTLGVKIAQQFSNETLCKRASDYKSIAGLIYDLSETPDFFKDAPIGFATKKYFYTLVDRTIIQQPLCIDHRAIYQLQIEPDKNCKIDLFISMLKDAFGETFDDQIKTLKMAMGLTLFGYLHKTQMACFLFGRAGAGKSLLLNILAELFSYNAVANVSPFDLDNDYHKAALAGKKINLVPELPEDKPIPSAAFKSVISSDSISAREAYGKVFNFRATASNWFNGNWFPVTKDHSEGFFRRWLIIHFKYGKPKQNQDPDLLKNIIEHELTGILNWAIQGFEAYLKDGIHISNQHNQCLARWKKDQNSVLSWLNDKSLVFLRNKGDSRKPLKKLDAYEKYKSWCKLNMRKPYNKNTFNGHMENAGHINSNYQGYSVYQSLTTELPPPPLPLNL